MTYEIALEMFRNGKISVEEWHKICLKELDKIMGRNTDVLKRLKEGE